MVLLKDSLYIIGQIVLQVEEKQKKSTFQFALECSQGRILKVGRFYMGMFSFWPLLGLL